jgi:hypothetical protein
VLPTDITCSNFNDCEKHKLQPALYISSHDNMPMTSTKDRQENTVLSYCQVGKPEVNIRIFVQPDPKTLDAPADLQTLQKLIQVKCNPCPPGWMSSPSSIGTRSLWTCIKCNELTEYVINPNNHTCNKCPEGGICDGSKLIPKVTGSVWNDDNKDGVYRISRCPPGFILVRDESNPIKDECFPCEINTYSVEEAIYDIDTLDNSRLWVKTVTNFAKLCVKCPLKKARCDGANSLVPLPGYWKSPNVTETSFRRSTDGAEEAGNATQYLTRVPIYDCLPASVCLGGDGSGENSTNMICMEGAHGPLCGLCREDKGYFKSAQGCRACKVGDTNSSMFDVIKWCMYFIGTPVFLLCWYFVCWNRLLASQDGDEEQDDKYSLGALGAKLKTCFFGFLPQKGLGNKKGDEDGGDDENDGGMCECCYIRILICLPGAIKFIENFHWILKNRGQVKIFIKIMVSFFQVAGSLFIKMETPWPSALMSMWKTFEFVSLQIFNLPGLDCVFGEYGLRDRLLVTTLAPVGFWCLLSCPLIVTRCGYRQSREKV